VPARLGQLPPLHRLSAALALGALLLAAPSARAAVPDPPDSVRLSDESSFTRWAYAAQVLPIRESPEPGAAVVAPVSMTTEDGLPEVYPLLRSWTDEAGRNWLKVRVPMPPKARTGWVEEAAVGQARLIQTLLSIDRLHRKATLRKAGRKVWSSRIGIGKVSTPTPAGHFWIRERLRSMAPGGTYGPWAFGTSAYSGLSDWPGGGVIGIHGTNQPSLIPGRPSHGCIRVPNRAIRRLRSLMPIGTPVWIR
jgi:L,D-transpeptidase-like protein